MVIKTYKITAFDIINLQLHIRRGFKDNVKVTRNPFALNTNNIGELMLGSIMPNWQAVVISL